MSISIIFKIIILFTMIFCHIVDDFYLQGLFINLKQFDWWVKNVWYVGGEDCQYDKYKLYKNDYIVALILHSFSWAFTINIPILIIGIYFQNENLLLKSIIMIVINTIIHAIVDNLKANKFKINLIQDQICHILQIMVLWTVTLWIK